MKRIIEPKSERAKQSLESMSVDFQRAYDFVRDNHGISLEDLGMDWNHTNLTGTKKKGIEFSLCDDAQVSNLVGNIKNVGDNNIGVLAYDVVGNLANEYVFRSLDEALNITSKLRIVDGVEILPSGEILTSSTREASGEHTSDNFDREEYRQFQGKLLANADEIYQGRVNEKFGKYTVVKSPSGFFLAYNKDYGNAIYIVADFEDLMKDKQTLKNEGGAIRIIRNGNWENRLREYMYPSDEAKSA